MNNKVEKARLFCKEVKELAKKYDLPFFVVTDGASATFNNGCEAVKNVKFVVISIATVLACCLVLSDLNSYYQLKYVESYGSKWVWYWKIWKVVGPKILDTL